MDFTREPIIETVITPKEGCKIVVRSSKNIGQEEYFVDALEVVSFGSALFFRSQEKPKAFLVPASDYEILEVREARMVLKNVGLDRSIKIGGGREVKAPKEPIEKTEAAESDVIITAAEEQATENRAEKKRDRRRQQRRRRGREEAGKEDMSSAPAVDTRTSTEAQTTNGEGKAAEGQAVPISTPSFMSSLLPPPPTLISETISRYKENVLFKNAFYSKEEAEAVKKEDEADTAEEKKQEVEAPAPSNGEAIPSPFATFWDDMTEPTLPPMPFIEKTEGEQEPFQQEPFSPEENKE